MRNIIKVIFASICLILSRDLFVQAQTGNQIAAVAAIMPVGTWRPVPQNSSFANAIQCCLESGNRLGFGNSINYDPVHQKLSYVGEDHGEPLGPYYLSMDIATNTWSNLGAADPTQTTSLTHAYDHNTFDINAGIPYYRQYGIYPIGNQLWWSQTNSVPWVQRTAWPITDYLNVADGTAFFNGPLDGLGSFGTKINGAVAVFNCAANLGEIQLYDGLNDVWLSHVAFSGNTSTYDCAADYSEPKNLLIFGGGNAQPRKIWKMGRDNVVHPLTDSPVDLGIQRGNMVVDPVSGNMIVLGGMGQLWELNPDGVGTWTQQTGARTPPASVYSPDFGPVNASGTLSAQMSDYGVIVYVVCRDADPTSCVVYLYKHAGLVPFATRCGMPGVIRCVGFDTDADVAPYPGFGRPPYPPTGTVGQNNTNSYAFIARDTAVKASGNSSLRFTVPTNAPPDVGSYYANFYDDLHGRCDSDCDIYVQYRQRFDSNYLTNNWPSAGGWKLMMFGAGDPDNQTFELNCQTDELVLQNTNHRGFSQFYNSCPGTGSSSHGGGYPLDAAGPTGTDQVITWDPINDSFLQTGRISPYCRYSQGTSGGGPPGNVGYFPPLGNCLAFVAGEWLVFEVHYHVGKRGSNGVEGASPNDEGVNSWVEAWMGRDGGHLIKFYQSKFNWSLYFPGNNYELGKIWFLAYDSGRMNDNLPPANTWYDELIISNNWVPEPDASGSAPLDNLVFSSQPTNITLGSNFSPIVTVTSQLAAGGTDTAFTGAVSLVTNGCGTNPTGTVSVAAVAGTATFSPLGATGMGASCAFIASATGVNSVTSNLFNVSGGGGGASAIGPGGLIGPAGLIGLGGLK